MNCTLLLIAFVTFAGSFFTRSTDPMIPQIAADMHVQPATAALLSTAFAMPYAFVQPVLGILADVFNKARLMLFCVAILAVASIACAFAPSFELLFVIRVIAGAASGGTMPIALALIGDLVPFAGRQVAISRVLFASMIGNLIGASGSGLLADLFGWRAAFVTMGIVGILVFAAAFRGLSRVGKPSGQFNFANVGRNYRDIFSNPLAKICFGAVFIEGVFLFGLFPHVASLLHEAGETRASIAGLVLAGFGLGGIFYTFVVGLLLSYVGVIRMMAGGGIAVGLCLLVLATGVPWQTELVTFIAMGLSFFALHGVIQIYASELAPKARGSATSLHASFFFVGQAIGPALYGLSFALIGPAHALMISAAVLATVGVICSVTLRRPPTPV